MELTVGVLVFDGVDELDFVGPFNVFSAAGFGRSDTTVVTIGSRRTPFRSGNGLTFSAQHDFSDAPPLDVLVVPGGYGTEQLVGDPEVLAWIRQVAASVRWLCSVCTGSFVLEAAGLVQGRRITTHSGAVEMLRASGSSGEVVAGERYVVDGDLVTSAGVSAGIDMALWVVGQLYGEDHARRVIELIEYAPKPPYAVPHVQA
jgi:transcriptional regulator GlxA family with amidase domain